MSYSPPVPYSPKTNVHGPVGVTDDNHWADVDANAVRSAFQNVTTNLNELSGGYHSLSGNFDSVKTDAGNASGQAAAISSQFYPMSSSYSACSGSYHTLSGNLDASASIWNGGVGSSFTALSSNLNLSASKWNAASATLSAVLGADSIYSPSYFYLKSPNGTVWRIGIVNDGALSSSMALASTDPQARYWRFEYSGSGPYNALESLSAYADEGGGTDLLSGISLYALMDTNTNYWSLTTTMTDGNPSTYFMDRTQTEGAIIVDFGVGVTRTIRQMSWASHTYGPSKIRVLYSSDNVTYTEWWNGTVADGNVGGTITKSGGSVAPAVGTAFSYWIVKGLGYRDNWGTAIGWSEIELRNVIGGSDMTRPTGSAFANSTFTGYPAINAFDNTDNKWQSGAGIGQYVGYSFASPINVRQISLRPPVDGFVQSAPPNDFSILASNDGINYWVISTRQAIFSWAAGVAQTFTVQP